MRHRRTALTIACVLLAGCVTVAEVARAQTAPALPGGTDTRNIRSMAEALSLEQRLSARPDDKDIRYRLLRYYLGVRCSSEAARQGYARHALWLTKAQVPAERINDRGAMRVPSTYVLHPVEDKQEYQAARKIWLSKVEEYDHDVWIMRAAATFFSYYEPETAGEVYRELQEKEPDQRYHWIGMQRMYWSSYRRTADKAYAAKALAAGEEGYRRFRKDGVWFLANLAEAAYEIGDYEKASDYAAKCRKKAGKPRGEIPEHYGSTVRARLALREGAIGKAKQYMLDSVNLPDKMRKTMWTSIIGPDLTLAKEMLASGSKKEVLEYLKVCRGYWRQETALLQYCIDTINSGGVPAFDNPRLRWRSAAYLDQSCP